MPNQVPPPSHTISASFVGLVHRGEHLQPLDAVGVTVPFGRIASRISSKVRQCCSLKAEAASMKLSGWLLEQPWASTTRSPRPDRRRTAHGLIGIDHGQGFDRRGDSGRCPVGWVGVVVAAILAAGLE